MLLRYHARSWPGYHVLTQLLTSRGRCWRPPRSWCRSRRVGRERKRKNLTRISLLDPAVEFLVSRRFEFHDFFSRRSFHSTTMKKPVLMVACLFLPTFFFFIDGESSRRRWKSRKRRKFFHVVKLSEFRFLPKTMIHDVFFFLPSLSGPPR